MQIRGLLIVLALAALLTGCGNDTSQNDTSDQENKETTTDSARNSGNVNGATQSSTIDVLGGFNNAENFESAIAPILEGTGIVARATDVEGMSGHLLQSVQTGNPPDLYVAPQPGVITNLRSLPEAAGVDLVASGVFTQEELNAAYSESELQLGQVDGIQYAIPTRLQLKSMIWYNPQAFEAGGYEIPTTWDELVALSDQIVADGLTPWCHGFESASASGWPGTDWIEDIVLAKDGPLVYDQWTSGAIGFTDDRIVEAVEMFLHMVLSDGYTFGGALYALSTNWGNAGDGLFSGDCMMYRQAQFLSGFFENNNPGVEFGKDYDFFPFVQINSDYEGTVMGGGVLQGMIKFSEPAKSVMRAVNTPEFQVQFSKPNNDIPPHAEVEINERNLPNALARKAADIVRRASVFRFDGSDLMPAAVGAGAFWSAVLDLVSGEDISRVLSRPELEF
jgi:alpha-glucoside transport system substrate-binding protein